MRLWITRDDEGFRLWRNKTYFLMKMEFGGRITESMKKLILTSITTLLTLQTSSEKGEIVEIDIAMVLPFAKQSESKEYIKTRKHK